VWLFRQPVALEEFIPQPGETTAAQLAAPAQLLQMTRDGVFWETPYLEELLQFAAKETSV
jgi:hypothetical protein